MPHLSFYAEADDHRAVLETVFALGGFRVFETYSDPGQSLREFGRASDVPTEPHGAHLMLFVVGAGPEPSAVRFELGAASPWPGSFRYRCSGLGLVQLIFGSWFQGTELRRSWTNHFTLAGALRGATTDAEVVSVQAVDWTAVTRASGRLNRAIRKLAVDRVGSRPVLPAARQLIDAEGLDHERGLAMVRLSRE